MPGPYRSVLNKHLEQIARLRDTDPPTPYEEISAILLAEHGIKIRPSSIWNFVKARAEGKPPREVAKIDKKYLKQQPLPPAQESPQHSAPTEDPRALATVDPQRFFADRQKTIERQQAESEKLKPYEEEEND
jgi:hypothetical protein